MNNAKAEIFDLGRIFIYQPPLDGLVWQCLTGKHKIMKQWNNRTPQQWDQNFKNVHVHSIQATLYCQDRSYIQKLRQSVWATDSVCCRGIVTLNLPILGNWSWMICLLQGDRHNEICSCSDGWNVIISLFTVDEICLERGNRFV